MPLACWINNLRQQAILAEELGFEAIWLGEHHFGPYAVGRYTESDPARRGPRGPDIEDPHRPDGEHRAVVAPDPACRGPCDPGQHDRGTRGGWASAEASGRTKARSFYPNADPRKDAGESGNCSGRPSSSCGRYGPTSTSPTSGANYRFPAADTIFSHPHVSAESRMARRGPGHEAARHTEALPDNPTRRCG